MTIINKNVILLTLMLLSAGLATALRPNGNTAQPSEILALDSMVPRVIGDWKELPVQSGQVVNPQQKDMLEKLYSQTLTRTYVNQKGYQVMLSIAHGKGQRDGLDMHKPDICYPAQGFEIKSRQMVSINLDGLSNAIRAVNLQTNNGARIEPLIYWTLVGKKQFNSKIEKKYIEIRYALNNEIPDGMLVRISSIDSDSAKALERQITFVNAWYKSSTDVARLSFFGLKMHD